MDSSSTMNTRKLLSKGFLIVLITLLGSTPVSAVDDQKLCAPFKNSAVDQSIVTTLLTAAEHGGLYRIEPTASNLAFGVQSVIGRIEVEFTDFQGGISLQSSEQIEQGPALVRVGTGSLQTNGFLVKQLLKGGNFFDVEHFPEVFFVSKELRWISQTKGILAGDLTLRGTTRRVTFHVDLPEADVAAIERTDKIQMKATTTIQRSDFGMDAFSGLADNEVDLSIQVVAARYAF